MDNLKSEEGTAGAPQRRRRRRRSQQSSNRRQHQRLSPNATTEEAARAADPTVSGQPKRIRKFNGNKNRQHKKSRHPHDAGAAVEQQSDKTSKRKRRKAKSQRHRGSRNLVRQVNQHSKMETSNETSAGGLVISGLAEAVDKDGEVDLTKIYVALIGRLDRRKRLLWSMPKGHVEDNESKAATAEREVWEETGIRGEVIAELGTIDYWFVSEGKRIHKTVHHHLLRYVDGDLNDEDPEVTEVQWIPAHQLIEHLAFADERKLARKAHDLLPEYARKEKAAGRSTPR